MARPWLGTGNRRDLHLGTHRNAEKLSHICRLCLTSHCADWEVTEHWGAGPLHYSQVAPPKTILVAQGRGWRPTAPDTGHPKRCSLFVLQRETPARREAGRAPRGASCPQHTCPDPLRSQPGSKAGPGGPQAASLLSPWSASPAAGEPGAAGRPAGPGAVPGPGSFSLATGCPLPPAPPGARGRARPQGRTLAPQPPLLEPEDADLGEDVHQVAIAEPAVLVGAVPPPAGRGPVPVLLPRLPLLADQAAGDGRCHGCSPARPRRAGRREAARRSAPAGTHPWGRGRAGASSARGAAAEGHPHPAAGGSCRRRGSPHGCSAVPPPCPGAGAPTRWALRAGWRSGAAPSERDSGQSRARSAPVGSGRVDRVGSGPPGSVASRGCSSAPSRRRPLARRCHRHGRGGYRRLFPAPA